MPDFPPGVTQEVAPNERQRGPGAAWKSIRSWYIVGRENHAINPDFERFLAKRMGAKTTEIKSSHVSFFSNSAEVARLIEQAARAAGK